LLWSKAENKAKLSKTTGEIGEQLAAKYLLAQGLLLIEQNVHCRQGEIDLIMMDKSTLVFIEVKYRKNKVFGGAIAAIPYKKQQKIVKTAAFYLQQQGLKEYNTPCRFDVIAIDGELNHPEFTWLQNAFE